MMIAPGDVAGMVWSADETEGGVGVIVAIRAQYPENGQYDWAESLGRLAAVGAIELAFYNPSEFLRLLTRTIAEPIWKLGLRVPTVHMAQIGTEDHGFLAQVLERTIGVATAVGCQSIVLHPRRGKPANLGQLMDETLMPLLEWQDCNLLWETFPGKRRILSTWEVLAGFCEAHRRNFICYDVTHMRRDAQGIIEDVGLYGHLIKAFHFSNWVATKQHLPIWEGTIDFKRVIKYLLRTGFEGSVTLEYLPDYHEKLMPDALELMRKLDQWGN